MNHPPERWPSVLGRTIVGSVVAGVLVFGCATPGSGSGSGSGYKNYTALDDAMADEIDAVVDGVIPDELRKDPSAIDFARIRAATLKSAYYFRCAQDEDHAMYLGKAKIRGHAKQAGDWFTALATAAQQQDHRELRKLHRQKAKICTLCHD